MSTYEGYSPNRYMDSVTGMLPSGQTNRATAAMGNGSTDTISRKLEAIEKNVNAAFESAKGIESRLFGARPEKDCGTVGLPISGLDDRLRRMEGESSILAGQLARIESQL